MIYKKIKQLSNTIILKKALQIKIQNFIFLLKIKVFKATTLKRFKTLGVYLRNYINFFLKINLSQYNFELLI